VTGAVAILYGCSRAECGYRTLPSTMGTPYTVCPLCRGPWVADPPEPLAETGKELVESTRGKPTRKYVVRPHLQSMYDRIEEASKQKGSSHGKNTNHAR
jgi:hypothetical protein